LLLSAPTDTTTPRLVVTDTVFSMDGDVAPIEDLLELCERYGALLVLDEAHAVLGPELPNPPSDWAGTNVVRVGTLSKTLGALGGFVAATHDIVDLLVNRARSYIFSTALPPADAAAALAALRIVRSADGEALTRRLAAHVELLSSSGIAASGHRSPIVPVIFGREQAALAASAALLFKGLWVPAIRPPTVPAGSSRLRVTVSAAHREADVAHLIEALAPLHSAARTTALR
jgi:7-keto-8-aminopelargonate synthetase-like enzyme